MTRKLKVGDKVKLVGPGWDSYHARDTIVEVERINSEGVAYGPDGVGSVGPGDWMLYRGHHRAELVEDKAEQQFKPGDKVHVEYDAVVSNFHGSRTEDSGRVAVTHPLVDGGFTTVPLDAVTKIAPPLPTGLGAIIRNLTHGYVYIRVDSGHWVCDGLFTRESALVWGQCWTHYEILSEGKEL